MDGASIAIIAMPLGFAFIAWLLTKSDRPEIHEKDTKVKHLNVFVEADEAYKKIYENDVNKRKK